MGNRGLEEQGVPTCHPRKLVAKPSNFAEKTVTQGRRTEKPQRTITSKLANPEDSPLHSALISDAESAVNGISVGLSSSREL